MQLIKAIGEDNTNKIYSLLGFNKVIKKYRDIVYGLQRAGIKDMGHVELEEMKKSSSKRGANFLVVAGVFLWGMVTGIFMPYIPLLFVSFGCFSVFTYLFVSEISHAERLRKEIIKRKNEKNLNGEIWQSLAMEEVKKVEDELSRANKTAFSRAKNGHAKYLYHK